jgi:hypothetical protein
MYCFHHIYQGVVVCVYVKAVEGMEGIQTAVVLALGFLVGALLLFF